MGIGGLNLLVGGFLCFVFRVNDDEITVEFAILCVYDKERQGEIYDLRDLKLTLFVIDHERRQIAFFEVVRPGYALGYYELIALEFAARNVALAFEVKIFAGVVFKRKDVVAYVF